MFLKNVTDAESEVPSMIQNRMFELRKESPSTVKIIDNDISSEMGTDVAQSMGLEYPCHHSDHSDDAIVEEKPVIPEMTYDGDQEEEEDEEDSEKEEEELLPPPAKLPPSLGCDLTKDTSMDGERMNVSEDESIITNNRVAIGSVGTVELKVAEEVITHNSANNEESAVEFKVKVMPKYDENVSLMGVESDSVVELPEEEDSGSDETIKTEKPFYQFKQPETEAETEVESEPIEPIGMMVFSSSNGRYRESWT